MCMCMCMGTKTITIMDEAYGLLLRRKRENESFSEVIIRLVRKKSNIMELAGAWSEMSDKDIEKMKSNIAELRKKSTGELIERVKK